MPLPPALVQNFWTNPHQGGGSLPNGQDLGVALHSAVSSLSAGTSTHTRASGMERNFWRFGGGVALCMRSIRWNRVGVDPVCVVWHDAGPVTPSDGVGNCGGSSKQNTQRISNAA